MPLRAKAPPPCNTSRPGRRRSVAAHQEEEEERNMKAKRDIKHNMNFIPS